MEEELLFHKNTYFYILKQEIYCLQIYPLFWENCLCSKYVFYSLYNFINYFLTECVNHIFYTNFIYILIFYLKDFFFILHTNCSPCSLPSPLLFFHPTLILSSVRVRPPMESQRSLAFKAKEGPSPSSSHQDWARYSSVDANREVQESQE